MVANANISADRLAEIKRWLGSPAYEAPGVLIYRGDCVEIMTQLPPSLFDLTITSPPYNIGKEYEAPRDIQEYLDWCISWVVEVYRLTQNDGTFWLNLGYLSLPGKAKAIPIPYLIWDRIPFYLIQEVVWNYGAGVASKKNFSPRNEKFLWYVKNPLSYTFNLDAVRDPDVKYPNQKKNGKLKVNPLGKNPTDVWQFPKVTSGSQRKSKERTAHPAQFPLAVIDRIVKASSNAGDVLFDPLIGSGTVAEAALANNRQIVGIEIEAKYVDIAAERIESYRRKQTSERTQHNLF